MAASATESVAVDEANIRAKSQAIVSQLMTTEDLKVFTARRSDFWGLLQAVVHLGLIVLFGAVSLGRFSKQYKEVHGEDVDTTARWGAFFLQALGMAFLFNGLHECVHFTAFKTRWLNLAFGNLFGLLTGRPFRHYTYYHFNHHKFTGDPKSDPELQDSFIDMKLDAPVTYLCYLSGVPFWIDRSTTLLRHALLGWVLPREKLFLTPKTTELMINEARLYVFFYSAVAAMAYFDPVGTFRYVLLHGIILPSLAAQPFLRFYLIAEHTGCPNGDNMLSNTRTTETFWWYRALAWQMPYHSEHHAFPNVPFHQLPALHQALASKERATKIGSFSKCDPPGDRGYLGVHVRLWMKFFSKK